MIRTLRCIAGLALLTGSTPAVAQYARTPADTVRIRETSVSTFSATTPGRVVEVRSEHDAVIAVAFGGADSARAWYESLRIAAQTPQGLLEPATDGSLNTPFSLRFDAQGRIETRSAPRFPASFEGVSDLSHQFDDLFLRLPSRPLVLGVSWEDTAVVETSSPGGESYRAERRIVNRVVRDTAIAGESAWIIASRQEHSIASAQPVAGQPLTMRIRLAGADSGFFVFSQHNGRLLARTRTGHLTGTMTYEGGPQPLVVPVRQRYENSVTRVP